MSLLVISDIHGNRAALDAVLEAARAEEPNVEVVCLGDIVGYGPESGACVERIMRYADVVVQGNHDHALAERVSPRCSPQFRWLAEATASLGDAQVPPAQRAALGSLPRRAILDVAGTRYLFVHATPHDPLYHYVGPDAEAWRPEVAALDADVLVVGHTHLQFDLPFDGTRIVNPGSVGQPKDGDPRAAYALIDADGVRLERVAYPVEETISALERSGVPTAAVEALAALLRTGRTSAMPPQPAAPARA